MIINTKFPVMKKLSILKCLIALTLTITTVSINCDWDDPSAIYVTIRLSQSTYLLSLK